jgi:hypothetical protein
MEGALANGEDALGSQAMGDDVSAQIDKAVSKRRIELEALSLREVGQEFQFTFQIRPDLTSGKESLIDRVLAKFRAQLERHA